MANRRMGFFLEELREDGIGTAEIITALGTAFAGELRSASVERCVRLPIADAVYSLCMKGC